MKKNSGKIRINEMLGFMSAIISFFCAPVPAQPSEKPQIALVNKIEYTDTVFNRLPGNGFLLDTGRDTLAVTCKHALWENRQKTMTKISFEGKLVKWIMYAKDDPANYIVLGELLNGNEAEPIGERNTDSDYLVFNIKENHSNITPLKISPQYAQPGDTVFKAGWSFRRQNGPQIYRAAVVRGYSGPSLLIQDIIQLNEAGSSGSPVVNSRNELVGIVSSWKYNQEARNWFEAPCSVDYLWEVLYGRWLQENGKVKTIETFREFCSAYSTVNGQAVQPSSHLYTSLFFNDWLNANGKKYATPENYATWTAGMRKQNQISIVPDVEMKSSLVFSKWAQDFAAGRATLVSLKKTVEKENVHFAGFMDFCELGQRLSAGGQHKKAIEALKFTAENIQHTGQVYAFLGDAYRLSGNWQLAVDSYKKCLEMYPGYPQALKGLANYK